MTHVRRALPAPPTPHRRPGALAALALAVGALLGGCADLRLETPPPPTPTPDAVEQVRDRTARDAVELADLATEAALTAPEAVATVLGRVAEVSVAHADAFGGVYEPFPEDPAAGDGAAGDGEAVDDGAEPTPEPAPADAATVLAALEDAAASTRTDADAVADGDLARLLGSVWLSRALLAGALSSALTADAGGEPGASPAVGWEVPDALPAGVEVADVLPLVRSEDAAGFAWEVVAARSADQARADAEARAALHRDRAEAWAVAAGVARGADDPRRAAYALPDTLTVADATPEAMAAVTADLEWDLAVAYTSFVARGDAGARGTLLDAMRDQVVRGMPAGAPVPAFPGLPERA